MKKYDKQRLFEVMGRLDPTFKPRLNEGDAFNDAGEPLMTHQQFNDYSEPAEPEYDDNEKPQYPKGMGDFNHVDWQMVHEQLVINTELLRANKTSDGNLMAANVGDFTDYDGMLSPEELKQLEAFNLIWIDGHFPMIDDEQYLDFETFKAKAAEIWDKDTPSQIQPNDSEAPYLRGREPMSEEEFGAQELPIQNVPSQIDGRSKVSAKNLIYKHIEPLMKGIFSDESWEGVRKIWDKFGELGLDWDFSRNSEYYGGMPPQGKTWYFEIKFMGNNDRPQTLFGTLTAAGAGSVEDPLGRYDITVVLS